MGRAYDVARDSCDSIIAVVAMSFLSTPFAAPAAEYEVQLTFDGGRHAAWSPDGSQIAFDRDENIWVIPASGGMATPIAGAVGQDPAWSPDGDLIAYSGSGGIWLVPAGGGTAKQITFDGGTQPDWSADGTQIAYGAPAGISLFPGSEKGPTQIPGAERGRDPTWSASLAGEQIAFEVGGFGTSRLWRIPATGGTAMRLPVGGCAPDWSPQHAGALHGRIAFGSGAPCPSTGTGSSVIGVFVPPNWKWNLPTNADGEVWKSDPAWSPDGRHIAFTMWPGVSGSENIWVIAVPPTHRLREIDLDHPQARPLTINEESWGRVKARYYKP